MSLSRSLTPEAVRAGLCLFILLVSSNLAIAGTNILIRAAGQEGGEQFQLVIDEVPVDTFVAGVDAAEFYYFSEAAVRPEDIRVEFISDIWDPENGIDANLFVDYIELNGQRFETEHPTVLSTGSWVEGEGIVAGFNRGEWLHSDGYFEYASIGSTVVVRASGDEGSEGFFLYVNGVIVTTFFVSTELQDFAYYTDAVVTPDRIQVEFFGDVWDPANGIDANLNVPYIEVDGVRKFTDDPDVFSSATWLPTDGFTPGFGRGSSLHGDGFFQFGFAAQDSGAFRLQTNLVTVDESSGLATVVIERDVADNFATIVTQVLPVTATPSEDYVPQDGLVFFDIGQFSKQISITIFDDDEVEGDEQFTVTIDNPLGAGLAAPRTATVEIVDDEFLDPLPNYPDFSVVTSLATNLDASVVSDELVLTSDSQDELGAAFHRVAIPVTAQSSFMTEFSFRLSGGTSGGEGFAFVLHSDPQGEQAVGSGGAAAGHVGIANSVAVRFDTVQNTGEFSNNAVALYWGDDTAPVAAGNVAFDLNSGDPLFAFVDYDGNANKLFVYVSGSASKPQQPVLTADLALLDEVGSEMFAGFTAATADAPNEHALLRWVYSDSVPPPTDFPTSLKTEIVRSGLTKPTAMAFGDEGKNLYIGEQRGVIKVMRSGVDAGTVLDMTALTNGVRDRGIIDIAVHPDLTSSPYLYTLYTFDPPQVFQNTSNALAKPDGKGNRVGRLSRWTLDPASGFTRVLANSEIILVGTNSIWQNFNAFANSTFDFTEPPAGILEDGTNIRDFIASDSESHTVGGLQFGTDGALYLSIGDGTSYNRADRRTLRVQDTSNLSGKVLRIDPINGEGLPSNPFFDGDPLSNRSRVWQLGLRNPFRISMDSVTGNLFVGDVGWGRWEEINVGPAGANFGWPFYEGGDVSNVKTNGYKDFPEAAAFYASTIVTQPSAALSHSRDGINAIVLGAVYRGTTYPSEYQGDVFFNDLGLGIVRHADVDASGKVLGYQTFATGARYVVQIVQGPDGNLYFVDFDDGRIGKWVFE